MATITTNTFSGEVVLELRDSTNKLSSVFLERIAPLYSAAGSGVSWDDMLKVWVGGYLGPIPYENIFRLRGMAAGNYRLYLYANEGVTTFYAGVNDNVPVAKTNSPTFSTYFVENGNYVVYDFTVPRNGHIYFKAVGYLSGLQLERV